ncbi:MAG: hypothetical protein OEV40_15190 [Acidimicrobiia bacterium]|nr:hypothetical protein [Acidimicrobiia bacterium]
MIQRVLLWAVGRYLGGPASSGLYTSTLALTLRALKSVSGRREVVDTSKIKRGQTIVIEHLSVSHAHQIREIKAEKKAAKQAKRAEAAEAKAARRRARRRRRLARLSRLAASVRSPSRTSEAG